MSEQEAGDGVSLLSDIDKERIEVEGASSVILYEECSSDGKRTQWTAKHVLTEHEEYFGTIAIVCVERSPSVEGLHDDLDCVIIPRDELRKLRRKLVYCDRCRAAPGEDCISMCSRDGSRDEGRDE